jgi:hypothetical protein
MWGPPVSLTVAYPGLQIFLVASEQLFLMQMCDLLYGLQEPR